MLFLSATLEPLSVGDTGTTGAAPRDCRAEVRRPAAAAVSLTSVGQFGVYSKTIKNNPKQFKTMIHTDVTCIVYFFWHIGQK
jgi:hypothetical protein